MVGPALLRPLGYAQDTNGMSICSLGCVGYTYDDLRKVGTSLNPGLSSKIDCVRLWLYPCPFKISDDYPFIFSYNILVN